MSDIVKCYPFKATCCDSHGCGEESNRQAVSPAEAGPKSIKVGAASGRGAHSPPSAEPKRNFRGRTDDLGETPLLRK